MSKRIALLLLTIIFCCHHRATAGLGAFLTVNNNTQNSLSTMITSVSPPQAHQVAGETLYTTYPWNSLPSTNGFYPIPQFSSYPASGGGQYMESNDSYSGASAANVFVAIMPPGSPSTSPTWYGVVTIAENNSQYTVSAVGSTTNYAISATAVPGPGAQWIITINVTSLFPNYSAASWMSTNPNIQNASLSNITIPGAHDAAMSGVIRATTFANACNTRTQYDNFYNMLANDGVRYFDCRPVIMDATGTNYLGHFSFVDSSLNQYIGNRVQSSFIASILQSAADTVLGTALANYALNNQGCLGMTLASALSQVKSYLTNTSLNNTHEVIILDFSHCMDLNCCNWNHSTFTHQDGLNLIAQIKDSLGQFLYTGSDFLTTPISAMTQTGSKVIVWLDSTTVSGYDAELFTSGSGIYPEPYNMPSNIPGFPSSQVPQLYNNYSNTNILDTMIAGQLNALDTNKSPIYFFLSWTLTESPIQTVLCLLGPTAVQTAYTELSAAGDFSSVALSALAGPYYGMQPSQAINAFMQQNPYTSIISLASQAVNNLYQIPRHCAIKRVFPNVLYGDTMGLMHLNTVYQLNSLRFQ